MFLREGGGGCWYVFKGRGGGGWSNVFGWWHLQKRIQGGVWGENIGPI